MSTNQRPFQSEKCVICHVAPLCEFIYNLTIICLLWPCWRKIDALWISIFWIRKRELCPLSNLEWGIWLDLKLDWIRKRKLYIQPCVTWLELELTPPTPPLSLHTSTDVAPHFLGHLHLLLIISIGLLGFLRDNWCYTVSWRSPCILPVKCSFSILKTSSPALVLWQCILPTL